MSTASERIELFNSFSKSLHLSEQQDSKKLLNHFKVRSAFILQAVDLMTEAINVDNNTAYNYYLRGLYRELGRGHFPHLDGFKDKRLIAQDYDMAIQLDPELARAYVRHGKLYRWDDKDKAEEYFRKAIEIDLA